MKLHRIELHGFKSFRAKAAIEIGEGITAIVGPNGCGKSNIIDAIRWAMGTQSARSLRGSEMSDVIFAGSRSQKPAGLAEVSLVFENAHSRQVDPIEMQRAPVQAMVAGSTALTVTRRLYRGGDTAYLINNVGVRLKDIHELFLGTGASVRGYSIIEQGQIEFLVNARPAERRAFVEELAGVTRYHYHRNETERKLSATQANLERLDDLLGEVKQRLGQLKRQAQQAEKYTALENRRRLLELHLLLQAERDQAMARASAMAAAEGVGGELEEQHEKLVEAEALQAALERDLVGAEERHRNLTDCVYRLRTKRDLLRQAVEHARGDHARLVEEASRLDADERELREVLLELAERRQALEAETGAAQPPAQADAALQEASRAAAVALARGDTDVDRVEAELRAKAARLAETQGMLASRHRELIEGGTRRAQAGERLAALDRSGAANADGLTQVAARLAEIAESAERLEGDRETALGMVEAAEGRVEEGRRQQGRLEEERAAHQARRAALAENAAADVGQGTRALLAAAAAGRLGGVVGALSDGIIAPPELERPLHGVLRDLLEYVVVEDAAAAQRAVHFAAAKRLVVGCIEARPLPVPDPVEGSLLPRLELLPWVPDAVRQILARARVVDGLTPLDADEGAYNQADAEGNCTSAQGFWRSTDPSGGAIARRARLQQELARLDRALEELATRQAGLSDESSAAAEAFRLAQVRERTCRSEAERLRARRSEAEAVQVRLQAEREALRHQREELERLQAGEGAKDAELAALIARGEADCAALQAELGQLEAARERARGERERLRQEYGQAQQALAASQAALQQFKTEMERLARESARLDGERTRAIGRLERMTARRAELVELQQRRSLEIEANGATTQTVDAELEAAQSEQAAAAAHLESLRQAHRQQVSGIQALRQRAAALRAEADRHQDRREAAEREQIRLSELLAEQHRLDWDGARAAVDGHELPRDARDQLAKLRQDIERLGPVNFAALEELQAAQERHDFLCTQQADLQGAISDLRLTIDELDGLSRDAFNQTFVALRAQFEQLFTHLFRGGEATLELCDDGNGGTPGVEVRVRPPGKKISNMSLMSGGEKALTAVAMVFAAFKLKPSPFCVLDEVDAPLDDQNVERFIELIGELSGETQFLVITHNRRTMEGADKLVGVTMEEPGCSRLMAVQVPHPRRPSSNEADEYNQAAG